MCYLFYHMEATKSETKKRQELRESNNRIPKVVGITRERWKGQWAQHILPHPGTPAATPLTRSTLYWENITVQVTRVTKRKIRKSKQRNDGERRLWVLKRKFAQMRFKKGDKVEVMNTSEVPISWRTAEIVSGNGHTCTVRYGSGLGIRSEKFEERVSRKMIRPCPAVVHFVETWAPGDIVEVYNDYCWKIAIVLSVLQLDCYLVRLLGCSLELSIHKTEMRDRQNWKDGKWIYIRKGCVQAGAKRSNKVSAQDCCQKMVLQLLPLDAPTNLLGETDGLATHGKIKDKSLKFQAIETDSCRLRAALAATLLEKVDATATQEELCITSERPNKLLRHLPRVPCRVSGVLCSDAESVCGSGPSVYKEKTHSNPPEEELATSVHTLELHAYKCTLVALYASGPLTWEQEAIN
ncbi:hypothetical protein HAX54_000309 [Datura stramonium]|uniref:ENT domain-containing protein n=1 Tax=Datura stramonium TaxID=4076 RepID=A0ABS8WRX4_DATST|nr:hypothetical protein [Datura stramonium]